MKILEKIVLVCLIMCSFLINPFAMQIDNSIIDQSNKGSITIYKYASKDGHFIDGTLSEQYVDDMTNGPCKDVEFKYLKIGDLKQIFDNNGDIAGSISKRPNLMPLLDLLEEKGDEIFEKCDSIILEIDIDVPIVKKVIELSCKHHKQLFAVVSNMSLAAQRRDFVKYFDCFICNQGEMSIFFAEDYDKCTPEQ